MSDIMLFNGDCLDVLPTLQEHSIDAIITDLPYGVTNKSSEAGAWDKIIPMDNLWTQFWRIVKPNGVIILFAQGMFTAQLMMSAPKEWRYNLVWDKCRSSGFLNANRMPLRRHEDICVFYKNLPVYNPQMVKAQKGEESHTRGKAQFGGNKMNRCYGKFNNTQDGDLTMKFPHSILRFPRPHNTHNHPTEKSVDLCCWLIKTYSNHNDTILDATMGSGTTGVACVDTGRKFIGIEKDEKYFGIAKARIEQAQSQPKQGELSL